MLELQHYLHEHIPLSKAMAVAVVEVTPQSVVLSAPLAPNINHHATVFGGSASTLAILSAWSLLHTKLRAEQIHCGLVIQRNNMEYDSPIHGTFLAKSFVTNAEQWQPFLRMLARKGRARLSVSAQLEFEGAIVGRFSGDFVALASPTST